MGLQKGNEEELLGSFLVGAKGLSHYDAKSNTFKQEGIIKP